MKTSADIKGFFRPFNTSLVSVLFGVGLAFCLTSSRAQSNGMFLKPGFDYQGKTNGAVRFVIHLPAGDTNSVFDLFETKNLSAKAPGLNLTNWLWLGRCAPGQTDWNIISATNTCAFYRLATTNADMFGNGLPDGWEWFYYGNFNQTATNLDSQGNTLGYDYTNQIVPQVFTFSGIEVANNRINTSSPSVQLDVTGYPYYVATLVDDTNFADAVWRNYTTANPTVSLGSIQGWHGVWIGLRGHADDTNSATWQWTRLKLDTTPPALTVTNPVMATVNKPVIQLQGYSSEALRSIRYDLSNAAGTVTNQPVLVEGQDYSTNTCEFSTNYFQAYDMPLTNGVNAITIHATDLAGNVATLTTNFIYAPVTNPPVVHLLWPLDGLEICGSNIVCRGQVGDPTANVTVQLVDATGATNTAGSRVGRDGLFYANEVVLSPGTNHLKFLVTDAAGNAATTNITVMTSDLGLTLDPVVAGQSAVTGTIDDDSYTVYVNGVQATNDGFGNWSATITPIGVGGGAVVVNAIQSGGDPTLQQVVDAPQGVFVSQYHSQTQANDPIKAVTSNYYMEWEDGQGGQSGVGFSGSGTSNLVGYLDYIFWPASSWPEALPWGWVDTYIGNGSGGSVDTNDIPDADPPDLAQEHCDINQIIDGGGDSERRTADTEMKLATGGPLGSTEMNLWCISASATDTEKGLPIPPEQIAIGGLGKLDTNGELYVVLPDNDPVDVTPDSPGRKNYTFNVGATEYHPFIRLNTINLDFHTPTNCVGEQMTFSIDWSPYPPDKIIDVTAHWSLPGTFVNTNSDPNCDRYYSKDTSQLVRIQSRDGTIATSCWYVKGLQGGTVSVWMNVTLKNGQQKILNTSGQFNVVRPTTTFQPTPFGTPNVMVTNGLLALRHHQMTFRHQINPGNFSGTAGYTQLVGGEWQTDPEGIPLDGTELDGKYGDFPRGERPISANTNTTVAFWDGPNISLSDNDTTTTEDLEFSTYLMFKPDGSGSIYVPLCLVQWELHDEAIHNPDNTWTPHNSHNGQKTEIKREDDSTAFPYWTKIYTGGF